MTKKKAILVLVWFIGMHILTLILIHFNTKRHEETQSALKKIAFHGIVKRIDLHTRDHFALIVDDSVSKGYREYWFIGKNKIKENGLLVGDSVSKYLQADHVWVFDSLSKEKCQLPVDDIQYVK
jgi:hypothetical protein